MIKLIFFHDLSDTVLLKDVGEFINELGEKFNHQTEIVHLKNKNSTLKNIYKKTIITGLDIKLHKNLTMYKYIIRKCRNTEYLILFHWTLTTLLGVLIYKLINADGKVLIKLDMNSRDNNFINSNKIRIHIYRTVLKKIDGISVETIETYKEIKNNFFGINISNKILYNPNGFDDKSLITYNIEIKNFHEKDNIMITVGRLGVYQKNTQLLLNALKDVDLKDWKIYFIGPIHQSFKNEINNFFNIYPEKRNQVIFLGNLGRKELLEFYNKSKVFLLTSRFEGFPLVYPEALFFGNYIVTTDIAAAIDITNENRIGKIIKQDDVNELKKTISSIIEGKINLYENYLKAIKFSNNQFLWRKIVCSQDLINFFK